MRELTFTGFLKSYVRALSAAETNSLYKLTKEAADENPRLREPLLLYAKFTDNTDVLLRAAKKTALYSEYKNLANRYDKAGFEAALQNASSPLPEEYKKVWRSYLSKKNRLQNDNHTKELMRNKVVKLQKAKGVSNYRLYADLGLNPGNFNTWLKYGDPSKVSLDTARRTVKYLENTPQPRL
ncbi:MAG: transcriptional regulator [Clostridiales bacterium]|nr:transcriptional regulator [Clostridiales bacterium]